MIKKLFFRTLDTIRSLFFNGLLIVLPITITFTLFHSFFKLIKNWLEPLNVCLPCYFQNVPQSEFLVVLTIILVIGVFVKYFLLKPLVHAIEDQLVFKIPLVRSIYSGIQQLINAITSKDQSNFNSVVLLEFPNIGSYTLGFKTSNLPKEISPDQTETYYSIFVPTTPNPTSGFLVILPASKFRMVDLTKQEAMALIISSGIIKPERFE